MRAEQNGNGGTAAIKRAAELISEALDLLDGHGGPAEAAAHLDLALQRLREALTAED